MSTPVVHYWNSSMFVLVRLKLPVSLDWQASDPSIPSSLYAYPGLMSTYAFRAGAAVARDWGCPDRRRPSWETLTGTPAPGEVPRHGRLVVCLQGRPCLKGLS